MAFRSLVPPTSRRPRSRELGPSGFHNMIRDQFTITSWLAFGALAQGVLLLIIGPLALLPVVAYLLVRSADTYLITVGWKKNPLMEGVIAGKTSAQIPDETGGFSGKAADSQVVVFLIGARNNHPLGLLAPNFKTLGDYFAGMNKEVSKRADEFDFLGSTQYQNSSQRGVQNEVLSVMYFKTYEGLHKYAHSELHREGWNWYNKIAKTDGTFSIYHETYVVPKGNWETIYANSHISNLASTSHSFKNKTTGETQYASPVVDATYGVLKTSKGRMDRSKGTDNDSYGPSASEELSAKS